MSTADRARWLAEDYAYVAWWQLRSLASRWRPEHFHTGVRRSVVVIPGIYEPWHFMEPLVRALHDHGHPVHVLPALHYNRRPVRRAASMVAEYLRERELTDAAIVAHSKGGLIGKYAMLDDAAGARVARLVAICSPFSGSRYARFALAPSLRAFSPSDATMLLLREDSVNERITSVYGTFDPLIPAGSVLPGARNIRLDIPGHFRILGDARTIETALAEVS
jgi:hypothetical protein